MGWVKMPTPLAMPLMLAHDEHVACENAIVVCKDDGTFSFWTPCKGYTAVWVEEEDDDTL